MSLLPRTALHSDSEQKQPGEGLASNLAMKIINKKITDEASAEFR